MPAMAQGDDAAPADARPDGAGCAGGYAAQQEATIRWLHRSVHFARLAEATSDPMLRRQMRVLSARCRRHATDPQMS